LWKCWKSVCSQSPKLYDNSKFATYSIFSLWHRMHSHSGAFVAVEYSRQDMHIRSRQARQLAPLLIIRPSSARQRTQQWPDHRLDSHRNTSNSPLAMLALSKKQKKKQNNRLLYMFSTTCSVNTRISSCGATKLHYKRFRDRLNVYPDSSITCPVPINQSPGETVSSEFRQWTVFFIRQCYITMFN